MPPHPSTSEGSALRKPRAKQGNRFLAHALPSTAHRRTPARCRTRCLACAPAIKSPARYRAGRAKQHNHARNVKPLSPSEESGAGSARFLVRPVSPALQEKVPRGGTVDNNGPWLWTVPASLSGQSFCAAHSTMPRGTSPAFYLLPGRNCLQALACSLPFGKKRKKKRPSMLRSLNKHRTPHLLSPLPNPAAQKKSP